MSAPGAGKCSARSRTFHLLGRSQHAPGPSIYWDAPSRSGTLCTATCDPLGQSRSTSDHTPRAPLWGSVVGWRKLPVTRPTDALRSHVVGHPCPAAGARSTGHTQPPTRAGHSLLENDKGVPLPWMPPPQDPLEPTMRGAARPGTDPWCDPTPPPPPLPARAPGRRADWARPPVARAPTHTGTAVSPFRQRLDEVRGILSTPLPVPILWLPPQPLPIAYPLPAHRLPIPPPFVASLPPHFPPFTR